MFHSMPSAFIKSIVTTCLVAICSATPSAYAGFFDNLGSNSKSEGPRLAKKDIASYEEVGKAWGERHLKLGAQPGVVTDIAFVNALALADSSAGGLDFFQVHADLKESFKKGYRLGYQDRTADLVLGPYLTAAAAKIGGDSADNFVRVVETFEGTWGTRLHEAINIFVTLISEGSQADRKEFIASFEKPYDGKYKKTQDALTQGGCVAQISEGGTTLCLDARSTVAVLNIPSTERLKTEIYHQTFKVMGDEWGKRFSHNLVRRDELVDLLRRSKVALDEVSPPPRLPNNLALVQEAFVSSYGTDAENVFASMAKDAGYNDATIYATRSRSAQPTAGTPKQPRKQK